MFGFILDNLWLFKHFFSGEGLVKPFKKSYTDTSLRDTPDREVLQ